MTIPQKRGTHRGNVALFVGVCVVAALLGGYGTYLFVSTIIDEISAYIVTAVGVILGGIIWAGVRFAKIHDPVLATTVAAISMGLMAALFIGLDNRMPSAPSLYRADPTSWRMAGLVVLLAIGAVVCWIAFRTARQPFCVANDDWLHWQRMGWTTTDDLDTLIYAINTADQDIGAVNALLMPDYQWNRRVRVEMGRCGPGDDGLLRAYLSAGRSSRYLRWNLPVPAAACEALGI